MSDVASTTEVKKYNEHVRVGMWIDRIRKNLLTIRAYINTYKPNEYDFESLLAQIGEQHRLLNLLRRLNSGKTFLIGASFEDLSKLKSELEGTKP